MRNKLNITKILFYRAIVWFLICAIFRGFFIFQNVNDAPFTEKLISLLYGMRLDASIFGYLMLFTIVFHLIQLRLLHNISVIVFAFLLFFNAVLVVIDAGLFQVWGHTINFQFFEYMKHPKEAIGSAGSGAVFLPVLFIVLGLVLAIVFGYRLHPKFVSKPKAWISNLIQMAIWLPLSVLALRGGLQVAPINQSFAFFSKYPGLNYAAINSTWNFIFTLTESQDEMNLDNFKVVEFSKLDSLFGVHFKESNDYLQLTNQEKPNVVVIILESFSANLIGFCNNGKGVTPNLDNIANNGFSFTHAYSSGNRTDKGLAAILSGYPAQANSSIITIPDKASKLPSIATALNKNGYHSNFYYGGEPEFANMKAYFLNTGYERVSSAFDFDKSIKRGKWGVADEYVYQYLLDDIEKAKTPFFKTVLTLSSHEPFDYPNAKNPSGKDAFARSLAYADACLGMFWEQVQKLPNFKTTLFVIVADHGRQIGDEQLDQYPHVSRIPIVFAGGALIDTLRGKQINYPVHQHHIPGNLLKGLGLQCNTFQFQNSYKDSTQAVFYTYFNGVGMFNQKSSWQFDNVQQKSLLVYGNEKDDSLSWKARLYQQKVMQEFSKIGN